MDESIVFYFFNFLKCNEPIVLIVHVLLKFNFEVRKDYAVCSPPETTI